MDFLAAALIQHDKELTALGESLQESVQRLNKERLLEKYESTAANRPSEDRVILEKMDEISKQLHALEDKMKKLEARPELEVPTELSPSQAKTFKALSYEKKMTISEVRSLTGRGRALETVYLNQLARLGLVEKIKRGRKYCYARRLPRQPLLLTEGKISKKVMILVLVSENVSEEAEEDVRELVSHRLRDLKEWQLEQSTILSK